MPQHMHSSSPTHPVLRKALAGQVLVGALRRGGEAVQLLGVCEVRRQLSAAGAAVGLQRDVGCCQAGRRLSSDLRACRQD